MNQNRLPKQVGGVYNKISKKFEKEYCYEQFYL